MIIELRVAGKPEGKGRARHAGGRTFADPKTVIAEREIRQAWREQGEQRMPDDAALRLRVELSVVRPQGHYKRSDGELSAEGMRHPVPRNKKPDVDNALKLVMDALNTRAYRDDVQIAEAIVVRRWNSWPETKIYIEQITDESKAL